MASVNRVRTIALVLSCVVAFGAAHAQLYKWTDANGKVHYSDTVPPEANNSARKQMDSDGLVRAQIERAQTQEERRVAAIKAEEDRKARVIVEERERRDKALVSTYTSLADFDRVRDRALAVLDAEITGLTAQLVALNAQRADLGKQIDAAGKKGPSAKLAADVKLLDADIAATNGFESKKIRDRGEMAKAYAVERSRLADLIAAQTKANTGSPSSAAAATPSAATPARAKAK
ncbi:MAG: DUF4124 domain-containing protein [Betaproteobacteria bacterium]|nr:MAG: DUF4124 domain-containing protein [Betaproteobacteria bacterium]